MPKIRGLRPPISSITDFIKFLRPITFIVLKQLNPEQATPKPKRNCHIGRAISFRKSRPERELLERRIITN